MKDPKEHWEDVYTENAPADVSWYQAHPNTSLRLIESTGVQKSAPLIDVGGGASVLVDHLLDRGYTDLAVLDLSTSALQAARQRLNERAHDVEWFAEDMRTFIAKHPFEIWHDRAVFHFLTDESDRRAYKKVLEQTLAPGGHLIIATFAIEGPTKCSGLEISRYDAASLSRFFGAGYVLKHTETETHQTPWATPQKFVYCHFQKT